MDVTEIDATLIFDCQAREGRAESVMRFSAGDDPDGGGPVFDLRQPIAAAWLDGAELDPAGLEPTSEGVRRLPQGLGDGEHELRVVSSLGLADVVDPLPVGWTRNAPGVVFDFWMSDLHPGRYLEQWIPSPLCHDRFGLTVHLQIEGSPQAHAVFANGEYLADGIRYPSSFTSLSPMLVVAPEPRVEVELSEDGAVTVVKLAGPEIDLDGCVETIVECLAHNTETFGPYEFGETFLSYVWGSTRGMEYDGATTSSVGALEHEVFHSWFGRGVKPATANDGWFDEAFCVWYTAGPPRQRRWAEPFAWDEPPVVLRPEGALSRFTPRDAYTAGPRLFAGIAAELGGPDALVATMADLYRDRRGGFVSTDELRDHLTDAGSGSAERAFDRWVDGKDT